MPTGFLLFVSPWWGRCRAPRRRTCSLSPTSRSLTGLIPYPGPIRRWWFGAIASSRWARRLPRRFRPGAGWCPAGGGRGQAPRPDAPRGLLCLRAGRARAGSPGGRARAAHHHPRPSFRFRGRQPRAPAADPGSPHPRGIARAGAALPDSERAGPVHFGRSGAALRAIRPQRHLDRAHAGRGIRNRALAHPRVAGRCVRPAASRHAAPVRRADLSDAAGDSGRRERSRPGAVREATRSGGRYAPGGCGDAPGYRCAAAQQSPGLRPARGAGAHGTRRPATSASSIHWGR